MVDQIYNSGGQIVTPDIYFQIGMNMISDMGSFSVPGYNPAIRADWETIWPTGGMYYWPNTASLINIYSSSASDTLAGTGAQIVKIRGLDINWIIQSEDVNLNGITAVQTINQYIRINSVRVIQAGSNQANVGTITIEHADESEILQTIEPQFNSSRAAIVSIPAGFSVGITDFSAIMVGNAAVAELIVLAHRENQPYQVVGEMLLANGTPILGDVRTPVYFSEKTDLEMITETDTLNRDSEVSANFGGILVADTYSLSTQPIEV